jgi:cytochrome d ubiquinol oxidase subunit I
MKLNKKVLMDNYSNFGYGFMKNKEEAVPSIGITFHSFHLMVAIGFYFIVFLLWILYLQVKDKYVTNKLALRLSLIGIILAYIATELGWIVAEMGRQPWTIQDILPVSASVSQLSTGSVQTTFFMFLIVFTALLIAEIGIMAKFIKKGPNLTEEEG